jgi:uncharacterized protein YecE (DUF72 family)
MEKPSSLIRIGTSNITLPGAKITFPPAFQRGTRLHYYSALFNTVEINSTFYKIPLRSTFEKWSLDVLDDFRFSVKMNRDITHAKDLNFQEEDVAKFLQAADGIGNRKGCLLLQFPASITAVYLEQVHAIIRCVEQFNIPPKWKLCVEFRHNSWYTTEDVWAMLNQYEASVVLQDKPKSKTPIRYVSDHVVYIRFHGPTGNYRDSYSNEFLGDYAELIREWASAEKEVYVNFNNTMGQAFQNAQYLAKVVKSLG